MIKPNDFDTAKGFQDFEPLELGGHVCKIMNVEEKKSSTGKDMIIVSLDIAEGKQAGYYSEQYKNNNKENKKWGCVVYQLVLDKDGNTAPGFKTFIDSVEKSNSGFVTQWGESFAAQFKGKLIGGVFGREQYKNNNNELKFMTKCFSFRTVDRIRKGVQVPSDKLYKGSIVDQWAQTQNTSTYDNEIDLPF